MESSIDSIQNMMLAPSPLGFSVAYGIGAPRVAELCLLLFVFHTHFSLFIVQFPIFSLLICFHSYLAVHLNVAAVHER